MIDARIEELTCFSCFLRSSTHSYYLGVTYTLWKLADLTFDPSLFFRTKKHKERPYLKPIISRVLCSNPDGFWSFRVSVTRPPVESFFLPALSSTASTIIVNYKPTYLLVFIISVTPNNCLEPDFFNNTVVITAKKKKYFSTYQTRSIITVVFVLGLK